MALRFVSMPSNAFIQVVPEVGTQYWSGRGDFNFLCDIVVMLVCCCMLVAATVSLMLTRCWILLGPKVPDAVQSGFHSTAANTHVRHGVSGR